MTARLVVLASGGGSNLQAILDAGDLDAQVVLVGADRAAAGALVRAETAGIATFVLPPARRSRLDYDAELADRVAAAEPDLVVLAGWLRLLSMTFLGRFPGRVVNLHPAFPGELPGLHAIERAHREAMAGRRSSTGVMVHLVPDEGVDDGPVLASEAVPIGADESLDSLEQRIHAVEHRLLVSALRDLLPTLTPWPP